MLRKLTRAFVAAAVAACAAAGTVVVAQPSAAVPGRAANGTAHASGCAVAADLRRTGERRA
ncbi:hypothetical protein [Streptomyces flaveolus]|uniref:Uncharacterized protein n=1 Tax=Streptomyces flaveolus TaxID=67297 RepID=A0ABV3AMQ5_9ACTN|nr:hypothetical protein [Streptomyces antibioticus]KOG74355.1 hypothetical protein ADK77_06070 [Streptomyces antibioticus]